MLVGHYALKTCYIFCQYFKYVFYSSYLIGRSQRYYSLLINSFDNIFILIYKLVNKFRILLGHD